MKTSQIILTVVIVIIVLALVGWYAYSNAQIAAALGLRHAPIQNPNGTSSTTPGRFGGNRGGFAMGSIEVLNDNGFTITLANGTTQNIEVTATTTIQDYASASSTPTTETPDQLTVGEQVLVIGASNPDGSVTASTIRTGVLPAPGQQRSGSHRIIPE